MTITSMSTPMAASMHMDHEHPQWMVFRLLDGLPLPKVDGS
jgi:hypothetical protein